MANMLRKSKTLRYDACTCAECRYSRKGDKAIWRGVARARERRIWLREVDHSEICEAERRREAVWFFRKWMGERNDWYLREVGLLDD